VVDIQSVLTSHIASCPPGRKLHRLTSEQVVALSKQAWYPSVTPQSMKVLNEIGSGPSGGCELFQMQSLSVSIAGEPA
jgi:hypothetical protein